MTGTSIMVNKHSHMQKRKFGNIGLEVSALGIGYMNLSFGTGKAVDSNTGLGIIRYAVEQGITFSIPRKDTASAFLSTIKVQDSRLDAGQLSRQGYPNKTVIISFYS